MRKLTYCHPNPIVKVILVTYLASQNAYIVSLLTELILNVFMVLSLFTLAKVLLNIVQLDQAYHLTEGCWLNPKHCQKKVDFSHYCPKLLNSLTNYKLFTISGTFRTISPHVYLVHFQLILFSLNYINCILYCFNVVQ